MKILGFVSQKGGSGKTILAVNVAVAAHLSGKRAVVVDTDPQRSATAWGRARQATEPLVATAGASELVRVLDAARIEQIDIAVIDTAPHAAPEAVRIVSASDLIIIPCRPSAFDFAAAEASAKIVKAAGARASFVLSACPFRAPEIAEMRIALSTYGFQIAPVEITDRRSFTRAAAIGQSVIEYEDGGKAALEIQALWKWIQEQLSL